MTTAMTTNESTATPPSAARCVPWLEARAAATTGIPAPGRAGGGANGGSGSMAAAGVHGRGPVAGCAAGAGGSPGGGVGSPFIADRP